MTTRVLNNGADHSAHRANQQHGNNNLKTKTNNVFVKTVMGNQEGSQEDEREFFIRYFMQENNVSREVAAAKYDSLN